MNPYANLSFARRLPHSGHAIHGPYEDRWATLADRIILTLSVIGAVLFAAGVV